MQRMVELLAVREKSVRRETRMLPLLALVSNSLWKQLFGKAADSLERSTTNEDECTFFSGHCAALALASRGTNLYLCRQGSHSPRFILRSARFRWSTDMINDREPLVTRFISIPKEYGNLNCAAFVAGIVRGVLLGHGFPAHVSAHTVDADAASAGPCGTKTVILIKFDPEVMAREARLG